jgi:hypothetical protein
VKEEMEELNKQTNKQTFRSSSNTSGKVHEWTFKSFETLYRIEVKAVTTFYRNVSRLVLRRWNGQDSKLTIDLHSKPSLHVLIIKQTLKHP